MRKTVVLAVAAGWMAAAAPFAVPAWAAKKAPPAAAPAAPAPTEKPADNTPPKETPQQFIGRLHDQLEALVKNAQSLDALHAAIGKELDGVVDYGEMAKLTVPQIFDTMQPAQRTEFVLLLAKMVQNTYVKRFKPGSAAKLQFGATKPLGATGRMEVQTTLTVNRTTADVSYSLLAKGGRWHVFDITVDEASQVQSYRKSFGKIVDKEGVDGLIARCRKAAAKKPS